MMREGFYVISTAYVPVTHLCPADRTVLERVGISGYIQNHHKMPAAGAAATVSKFESIISPEPSGPWRRTACCRNGFCCRWRTGVFGRWRFDLSGCRGHQFSKTQDSCRRHVPGAPELCQPGAGRLSAGHDGGGQSAGLPVWPWRRCSMCRSRSRWCSPPMPLTV